MSHDVHPTQSRLLGSLVTAIIVLAAIAGAISVGLGVGSAAGQAAPNDTATANNTTGSAPPASSGGTDRLDRLNPTSRPQQESPTRNDTNGTRNATGDSPGIVEVDESWSEYVGVNETNGSASNNGGGGGLGGGILGGVYSTGAGVLDHLAGSTDEWAGGFTKGAQAFFSWMLGFFIKQADQIVSRTIDPAINATTMTPHPNRVNNFYHNPNNLMWGMVYDTWEQTGQPLTRLLWIASLGFLLAFGNQFGVGTMSYAREKQGWVGLAISAFFITDAGWTLTNIVPHIVDVFTQAFVSDVTTTSLMNSAAKGAVVLFVLVLIYFEFFFVLFLLFVAGLRIGILIAFAPFITALVVVWFSPFKMLSSIAKAAVHLWLVLLLSAMPSTLLLNASFTMAEAAANGNAGALGTIMVIPLVVGGLLAAALMPFLLWKASSKLMGMLGGGTPGPQSSPQWRKKMAEYRQKAARPNRFQRGFRRKDPVQEEGASGAHRTGEATRNAPSNAKNAGVTAGKKAKNAPGAARAKAQNTASSVREASSSAANRAAKMSQKVTKIVSR